MNNRSFLIFLDWVLNFVIVGVILGYLMGFLFCAGDHGYVSDLYRLGCRLIGIPLLLIGYPLLLAIQFTSGNQLLLGLAVFFVIFSEACIVIVLKRWVKNRLRLNV